MKKVLSTLTVLFSAALVSLAQTSSPLDSAKVLVASNRTRDAIPVLERLMVSDPRHPAHNYFLGLCLVREGTRISEATALLEKAAALYAGLDVDPGMGEPELVHFYLVIAYCKQQECEKALQRYYELVEVYSGSDPFYTKEAVRWVELCHEPKRLAQELATTQESSDTRTPLRDRLTPIAMKRDSVVTRTKEYTTRSVLYGVQVGALLKPAYTAQFAGLRNVGVYVDENGIYRYVIGNLSLRSQAEKLLEQVRSAGYPDAFIVDINNPHRYSEEVVLLNAVNIDRQIKGKVVFSVQIGAFSEVLPGRLAQLYFDVEGLREEMRDGMTVLTVGDHDDYDAALSSRDRLAAKGFADAFITAYNDGQRIPVPLAIRHLEQHGR
jgi:tetratricopeptide (TPR) repeat protein